ncbi:type IV secretory system conjugative DNA transfer family protein [Bradyrhizobium sp. NBAIM20]|uniref:type IV secretory system conjugative DNA transfer family protein n=1 Tax=unclassified Bradyrhizobium TaxID=2631580 RepID=UPI001CD4A323|nr:MULTISPECIES: type IV secretory system conjugative DNA transfer family protein [unclassified Bradyrhizobium]MCA1416334.1 type IV secretory system conjugative DNA transfer family protein [Bradyrhizobium sp. NBAIM20]MCA1466112.1 type IV secretory system conjugative DNA transfer family protein [Bradyrhizobium sp. NBAIM18]
MANSLLGTLLTSIVATMVNKQRYRRAVRNLQQSDAHGGAHFLSSPEILGRGLSLSDQGRVEGLLLGSQASAGQPATVVVYPGDRHAITFAPTRSGKGTSHIIPNLLLHEGAAFIIDVKGENFLATQRRRSSFGLVHAFAPYDGRITSSRINPLDFIRINTANEFDDAQNLAAWLIEASGSEKDKFWETEARTLLVGVMLSVAHHAPPQKRTISTVRDLLTRGLDDVSKLLDQMANDSIASIATIGRSMRASNDDVLRSVLTTANSQMACWAPGGALDALTSTADFSFEELRSGPSSLYVIIPPDRIRENRSLLRVLTGMAIRTLTRSWPKPGASRILFMLDEFANLGRMEDIEDGVTYLAGNGIQLWMIVQDFSQLKFTYKEKAQTIFANCGARMFFNVQDFDTAKIVSDMIGNRTLLVETPNQSSAGFLSTNVGTGHSLVGRPLLTPDEVLKLARSLQLAFLDENPPILATKWQYFERPEFKGLYDDPRPLMNAPALPMLARPTTANRSAPAAAAQLAGPSTVAGRAPRAAAAVKAGAPSPTLPSKPGRPARSPPTAKP